jgi:hypothetical protein
VESASRRDRRRRRSLTSTTRKEHHRSTITPTTSAPPILNFESTPKLLWLTVVALPTAASDDLDPRTSEVMVNCSLVVVVLAVIPWRYVWRTHVRAPAERWR